MGCLCFQPALTIITSTTCNHLRSLSCHRNSLHQRAQRTSRCNSRLMMKSGDDIGKDENTGAWKIKCMNGGDEEKKPGNGDDEFGFQKKDEDEEGRGVATMERESENTFDTVLQELTAIQSDGPRNIAILGTRYSSYLHQQMIELLTYANVLIGNHVFTSGAGGTNAAVIRGALRAEKPDLLTVVLPQSLSKQPKDIQEQLCKVGNLIQMSQNDDMPLDIASQLCNSDILSRCTHFTAFAFHNSDVVLQAVKQAKELRMIVTLMYLD